MNEYDVHVRLRVIAANHSDASQVVKDILPTTHESIPEWVVDSTKKIGPALLYRCSECKSTLTEEEYEEQVAASGQVYCMCKWTSEDRILIPYEVYIREK